MFVASDSTEARSTTVESEAGVIDGWAVWRGGNGGTLLREGEEDDMIMNEKECNKREENMIN